MTFALAVLLSSLTNTKSTPFHVTIGFLEGQLPTSDRDFLKQICQHLTIEVSFLPLPHREVFISQGHISPTTFAKFLLADAIEGPHLWIDADTVALPGWDTIFTHIFQCTGEQGLVVAARGETKPNTASTPSALPFNAGVLGWPGGTRRNWETPLSTLDEVDTQEQFLFNQLYAPTATQVSEKFNLLTYRRDALAPDDLPFIVHYAGAHKPWHLKRTLSVFCLDHNCPWSAWFAAEKVFLAGIAGSDLERETLRRQKAALTTGSIRARRDNSGYNFLRLLSAVGPGAHLITTILRQLKEWVPRGTHPIH